MPRMDRRVCVRYSCVNGMINMKSRGGEFYSRYKKVRNRFRKFDSNSLIFKLIEFADQGGTNQDVALRFPWVVLLLVKWIVTDEEFETGLRKEPTERDIRKLVNEVLALNDDFSSAFGGSFLLFRSLRYQQQFLSRRLSLSVFLCQYRLFSSLESEHWIRAHFLEKTGFEIKRFIELLFSMFCLQVNDSPRILTLGMFDAVADQNETKEFLDQLTLSTQEQIVGLREKVRISSFTQFYERSPLAQTPLLPCGDKFIAVHRSILKEGCETWIYNFLRENAPQRFMEFFGAAFEDFICARLEEASCEFIRESVLRTMLGKKSKVVDFVVSDGATRILVEVKGVSASPSVMIPPNGEKLLKALANSAAKALRQGFEVETKLEKRKDTVAVDDVFLLVITLEDFLISSGTLLRTLVDEGHFDSAFLECDFDCNSIPLENVFFVPVEQLMQLLAYKHHGIMSLSDALVRIRDANRKVDSAKLDFLHHFQTWGLERVRLESETEAFDQLSADLLREAPQ